MLNENHEILDEHIIEDPNNSVQLIRIIQLAIGTIILYFIFEIIRKYVPENLVDWNGAQIKSIGLLIIGIVIMNSILIPNYLNKLNPKLSILKIVGFTGLIIIGIEFVFKIIQSIILVQNEFDLGAFSIIKGAGIFCVLGMLIANIRIHKLRKKKILIPILILIVIWISIGLIIKNTSG